MTPKAPSAVARIIARYPNPAQAGVLRLRDLIFEVAAQDANLGPVEETLRWGQPAYLAPKGSALRIAPHKAASFALYAHCQSRVIATYAQSFPGWDKLDGNRAILFDDVSEIEPERLAHLVRHALSYHAKKTS
ncbi:MAG: DUF1801 domain-containing protein [Roseovarius sp.]